MPGCLCLHWSKKLQMFDFRHIRSWLLVRNESQRKVRNPQPPPPHHDFLESTFRGTGRTIKCSSLKRIQHLTSSKNMDLLIPMHVFLPRCFPSLFSVIIGKEFSRYDSSPLKFCCQCIDVFFWGYKTGHQICSRASGKVLF